MARVADELGAPVVLVNNAGMTSATGPDADGESGTILTLNPDMWRRAIDRNLDTAYLVTRAALPHMLRARWGRVVMVASVTGPVMAMRGEAAYAAAKAGMVGLARAVAVDHAADGVTANAVAPGWIATASQAPGEAVRGAADADRPQRNAGRGGRSRGLPVLPGGGVRDRPVPRRRRREHRRRGAGLSVERPTQPGRPTPGGQVQAALRCDRRGGSRTTRW